MPFDPHLIKALFQLAGANPVPGNKALCQKKPLVKIWFVGQPSLLRVVVSYTKAWQSPVREIQALLVGRAPRTWKGKTPKRCSHGPNTSDQIVALVANGNPSPVANEAVQTQETSLQGWQSLHPRQMQSPRRMS